MSKTNKKDDYLSSLKSIETENYIDRIFYRPLGYKIAKLLQNTGITPNAVTIISIFVGITAGVLWYFPYDIGLALLGILALVSANILDCVDGQLARLTGIKSEVGRILDGVAGDLWFLTIYIAFAHRLGLQFGHIINPWWFAVLIVLSGLSHLNQAALVDYYKTLHLFFISKEKGKEFENSASVMKRYQAMSPGINKIFTRAYYSYTKNQEKATPQLQKLLTKLRDKFNGDIPDEIREELRGESRRLMPLFDINTFNGRSIILFTSVIFNIVWLYFLWEIVVLNIVKVVMRKRHERVCREVGKRL